MLVDVSGLDRGKVTSDMATEVTLVDGRGVEPVVVAGGEVDDHVVELIALGRYGVEKGLDAGVVMLEAINLAGLVCGVCGISDVTEEELVEAVGAALDTIDGAVSGRDFADSKNTAVTG